MGHEDRYPSIVEGPDETRATIPIRVGWGPVFLLGGMIGFWICGFVGSLLAVVVSLIQGSGEGAAIALWYVFVIPVAVSLLYGWQSWYRFGKEIVTLQPGCLTLRYDLRGRGPAVRLDPALVRNLRAEPEVHTMRDFWSQWGCGDIVFEYRHQTYRFGIGLGPADAEELAAWLRRRLATVAARQE